MRRLMAERDALTVVADQYGNPTLASDLATAVVSITERAPYGTYHAVNAGVASWHEWATAIANLTRSATRIDPIPGSAYERAATPPQHGALQSLALPGLGIDLPDWRDALRRTISS
jgi:dTDP-4-dehydrorhamnose reductase